MKRWDAFNTVCEHLRTGLLGGWSLGWHSRPPWEAVVEISSKHLVTPTLAWCLKSRPSIPTDVREYFDGILSLNATRNEHISNGLARVVAALNAIDIEPVLLKGAAHLVEGLYPAPGARLLGDVDVLVPQKRVKHAATALSNIGFIVPAVNVPDSHHHLPGMRDPASGLLVELHTRIEGHADRAVAPVDWFLERARSASFRGLSIGLPEPTRCVGHNIVHSQLNGTGHPPVRVHLRHILDLALIRARHEQAIDWVELDHRFSKAGCGQVLANYLKFGEAFLGQRMPRLSTAPRAQALARVRVYLERPDRQLRRAALRLEQELREREQAKRRTELRLEQELREREQAKRRTEFLIEQELQERRRAARIVERQLASERRCVERALRREIRQRRLAYWNRIVTMPFYYIAARRRDPAGLRELFRSETWPHRLRRLRDAIKRPL